MTARQSSGSVSATGSKIPIPALLTRMSGPPGPWSMARNSASTDSCARTSHTSPTLPRPISRAARSASPARRAVITTVAPSAASASAMPRPIPRLPPVTSATLPARTFMLHLPGLWPKHRPRSASLAPREVLATLAATAALRVRDEKDAARSGRRRLPALDPHQRAGRERGLGRGEQQRQLAEQGLVSHQSDVPAVEPEALQCAEQLDRRAFGRQLVEGLDRRRGRELPAQCLGRLLRAIERAREQAGGDRAIARQARAQPLERGAAGGGERAGAIARDLAGSGLAVTDEIENQRAHGDESSHCHGRGARIECWARQAPPRPATEFARESD